HFSALFVNNPYHYYEPVPNTYHHASPTRRSSDLRALDEQLPLIKRDGGFVRSGYDSTLDETRNLRDASRLVVASMQARYADQTRSEEHTSELQSRFDLVCRLLLEKKK